MRKKPIQPVKPPKPVDPSLVRIDKFITSNAASLNIPFVARTPVQRLIDGGHVTVNGVVIRKKSFKVKPTDIVGISGAQLDASKLVTIQAPLDVEGEELSEEEHDLSEQLRVDGDITESRLTLEQEDNNEEGEEEKSLTQKNVTKKSAVSKKEAKTMDVEAGEGSERKSKKGIKKTKNQDVSNKSEEKGVPMKSKRAGAKRTSRYEVN